MENPNSHEDAPSRDSSISLEDHNGRFPRLSRSDLYTAHQQPRVAYGPVTEEPFLMIPLDFPSTYSGDDPSAAGEPLDASVASSSLSVLRLERYLAEEHCHERLPLGVPPLGSNRATVKRYLDEITQNIDGNDASQAAATRGTTTDCDERGSRRSTTSSVSSSSAESSEFVRAHESKSALCDSSNMTPSLAGIGETDMARLKPEQASADSESHDDGPDLEEGLLEAGQILMYVVDRLRDSLSVTNGASCRRNRTEGHERQDRWRVGKRARVKRSVRRRRRREELRKDKANAMPER